MRVAINSGGGRQNLIVTMLVCCLAACETSPKNLAGNSFDANSAYCRQLWLCATTLYQNSANLRTTRATTPSAKIQAPVSQIKRTDSRNSYDRDRESLIADNLREEN